MENSNSFEYLEKIKAAVIDNLRHTGPAPSVQMQDVPRQPLGGMTDEEEAELDDLDEDEHPDERMTQQRWEKRTANEAEFEESDDEDMRAANGVTRPKGKKRNFRDFRHSDEEAQSGVASPNGATAEEAPEAEVPADADVTIDDPAAQTEEAAETEAPGEEPAAPSKEPVVDEDGDVGMNDSTDAVETTAIKEEEVEPEAAPPAAAAEKTSKPASRAATAEPKPAEEPATASDTKDEVDAPTTADKEIADSEEKGEDSMDVDEKPAPEGEVEDKK
jgi:histone deacetylase 1/2